MAKKCFPREDAKILWKWKVAELAIDARVELIPIESSEYLKITCVSITNRFYFAVAILKWLPIICETKSVHVSLYSLPSIMDYY